MAYAPRRIYLAGCRAVSHVIYINFTTSIRTLIETRNGTLRYLFQASGNVDHSNTSFHGHDIIESGIYTCT